MLLEMQNLLAARRIGEILAAMSRSDDDLGFGDICDVNGDSKMKIRCWQRLQCDFDSKGVVGEIESSRETSEKFLSDDHMKVALIPC